jgi:hypothetical protein
MGIRRKGRAGEPRLEFSLSARFFGGRNTSTKLSGACHRDQSSVCFAEWQTNPLLRPTRRDEVRPSRPARSGRSTARQESRSHRRRATRLWVPRRRRSTPRRSRRLRTLPGRVPVWGRGCSRRARSKRRPRHPWQRSIRRRRVPPDRLARGGRRPFRHRPRSNHRHRRLRVRPGLPPARLGARSTKTSGHPLHHFRPL